jgi:hypothetical protein
MIACISIPYFAAAIERRADKTLARKPLAIGGRPWEAKPVYAFSREVARNGVQSGMSLRLVQVLSPQSHFMPAAEDKYYQVSGEVIDVLTDFSCLVEPQELWHSSATPRPYLIKSGRTLPARYCLDLEGLPVKESITFVKEMGKILTNSQPRSRHPFAGSTMPCLYLPVIMLSFCRPVRSVSYR